MKLLSWTLTRAMLIALIALGTAGGCGDDDDDGDGDAGTDGGDADGDTDSDSDADSDSDGGTDGGGDADSDADSDSDTDKDGDGVIDRGDPADYPEECLESCADVCDRIIECDGENHPHLPLVVDECEDRCSMSADGMMWEDVSENLRCCASQDECDDVAGCGGWLDHPQAEWPCQALCQCFFGGATVAAFTTGVEPPPGYAFATDVLVIARTDHSVAFDQVYGAEVISSGRHDFVRFPLPLGDRGVAHLDAMEKVLPTLVDPGGRVVAIHGGITVRVQGAAGLDAARRTAGDLGLSSPEKIPYADDLYFIAGEDGWLALEAFWALDDVDGVTAELDLLRTYEPRAHIPNDPMFDEQWHLYNDGSDGLTVAGVDCRVTEAWDITQGSSDVVIAILDNGVDLFHPDLVPNLIPSDDPVEDFGYPEDWEDQLEDSFGFHGTPCSGVAAAVMDNDEGGAGVCPNCSILPHLLGESAGMGFQVTDKETADIFVKLVDAGAWIISNSWGPQGEQPTVESPGFPYPGVPAVIGEAFDYAETDGRDGKGTVILFAAGNSNQDITSDYYGAHANVITVSATDDQGLKSYYSNYGGSIEISAPSNGGFHGVPAAPYPGPDSANDPGYGEFSGTSSACPYAAGVVGLILSENPELTAAEARNILYDSAAKIDPVWGDWKDGWSPFYGYGLANAYRAVRMAAATDPCTDPAACLAPSDETCGDSCETLGACSSCRTDVDCGQDEVCQALPALGHQICVLTDDGGGCEPGYASVNGYCVPDRDTCDLCGGDELCNGRDDNCDDAVDEASECDDEQKRCLQNAEGCPDEEVCAATSCRETCETDDDCGAGSCLKAKDRFGELHSDRRICYTGMTLTCQMGCDALASSLDDETLPLFVSCVEDNPDCMNIMTCAMMYLPIEM